MYFGTDYSFLDNNKDCGVTKMKRSVLYIYNPEEFSQDKKPKKFVSVVAVQQKLVLYSVIKTAKKVHFQKAPRITQDSPGRYLIVYTHNPIDEWNVVSISMMYEGSRCC
jgi:hypothetical protein